MRIISAFAALVLLAGGVYFLTSNSNDSLDASSKPASVTTPIINQQGQTIGEAVLTQVEKGVIVHVEATGLSQGWHGIHIHETGTCTAPDFKSAGAHFNPADNKHGFNAPNGYHNGDLPNILADQNGAIQAEFFTPNVTLAQGKDNSLLKPGGTALVIHAMADDYTTDPSGNSGDRVACAVINAEI